MSCACYRTLHTVRILVPLHSNSTARAAPATATLMSSNRRRLATSSRTSAKKSYQLLVVGGGTAGSAVASKFASKLGQGKVAVLEPSAIHYYQPMFTLVGIDRKKFSQTMQQTKDVLPKECDWIQDAAAGFDPDNNTVTTVQGDVIAYDYMVVTMGLQLNFDKVKGLTDALENDPRVCSNYSPAYVKKTWPAAQSLKKGQHAIFTFPNTPIKCAGAPQKICYLVEDYLTRANKREGSTVTYVTSLPAIFGIPKYADALMDVVQKRNIALHTRQHLVEVRPDTGEAVFEKLDSESDPKERVTLKYDMLHVTPPMSSPRALWNTKLVDGAGYVEVDKATLQHVRYPNVFALGDCSSLPTSKTAAACAGQAGIAAKNLRKVMAGGQDVEKLYDGYTSCPLVITKNTCIMAEFGYDGKVLETFPVNQAKPRYSMYYMKANFMPALYWRALVKGMWNGPKQLRKLLHLGFDR